MSTFDRISRPQSEFRALLGGARSLAERVIGAMKPSVKSRSVLDLVSKGALLASILGITDHERDMMFVRSCEMIRAGEIQNARDWLFWLCQLEPFDARVNHAIAISYRIEDDFGLTSQQTWMN